MKSKASQSDENQSKTLRRWDVKNWKKWIYSALPVATKVYEVVIDKEINTGKISYL